MTQYQQPYQPPAPPPSNGLGVAGFIVSLVAIPTGGILSPIALFLSFIALFRRPRGFAFAGFVLGFLGTVVLAVWLSFFGFLGFTCFNIGKPMVVTSNSIDQAQQLVVQFQVDHNGALPTEIQGSALMAGRTDGWGHELRYTPLGTGAYEIRSAGADGTFGTQDDLQKSGP
ncbi:MAG TPA: type II secretion system protein GspG [Phycisphaerae bacterium]|jgi:hypothetical protein